jgi:hypothetical protein
MPAMALRHSDYVLGYNDREQLRLIRQARILAPLTESFLRSAGIVSGMRVLDIGCGMGDVTMLAAQRSHSRRISHARSGHQRTCGPEIAMSALGHKRTSASLIRPPASASASSLPALQARAPMMVLKFRKLSHITRCCPPTCVTLATLLPDVTIILIHIRFRSQSGHLADWSSFPRLTRFGS